MSVEYQPVTEAEQFNPEKVRLGIDLLVPRNGRYRLIRDAFENLLCQRDCLLEIIQRDVIVGTEKQVFRSAEPFANKTIVINNGDMKVYAYESEILLGVVAPYSQITLPQRGTGRIWLKSYSGSQPCVITTYVACDCGRLEGEVDFYDRIVGELLL